jgi:hypothetical protein
MSVIPPLYGKCGYSLNIFSKLQTCIDNSLLVISTWTSYNRHSNFHVSIWFLSVSKKTCPKLRVTHFGLQQLQLFRHLGKKIWATSMTSYPFHICEGILFSYLKSASRFDKLLTNLTAPTVCPDTFITSIKYCKKSFYSFSFITLPSPLSSYTKQSETPL